jgi:hypothetical protein
MSTAPIDYKSIVKAYLDAFEARDADKCMEFFTEESSIDFQNTVYTGLEQVRDWHKDRFEADLKLTKIEGILVKGSTVKVDCVAASSRLAAWNVKALPGRLTIKFDGDKVKEGKLEARMMNVFDFLRSGE